MIESQAYVYLALSPGSLANYLIIIDDLSTLRTHRMYSIDELLEFLPFRVVADRGEYLVEYAFCILRISDRAHYLFGLIATTNELIE